MGLYKAEKQSMEQTNSIVLAGLATTSLKVKFLKFSDKLGICQKAPCDVHVQTWPVAPSY